LGGSIAIHAVIVGTAVFWIADKDVRQHEPADGVLRAGRSPHTGLGAGLVDTLLAAVAIQDSSLAVTPAVLGAVERIGHVHGRGGRCASSGRTSGAYRLRGIVTFSLLRIEDQVVFAGVP